MKKQRQRMTTVKVQRDLAKAIYTIATARGITAHDVVEQAMRNTFGAELEAVKKLQEQEPEDKEEEECSPQVA